MSRVIVYEGTPGKKCKANPPVGLIEGARYETLTTTLHAGDRLFMVSDGVTEAADATGTLLDDEGFAALIRTKPGLRGLAMVSPMPLLGEQVTAT